MGDKKRIIATTNLHGRLDEFKALLNHIQFNFSEDRLFILGNILNEGPKQIELLDYLIELKEKHPNNIYLIYGEVEKLYIEAFVDRNFKAEQKLTKTKNVFYDYLDNLELRNKHIMFLVRMKDNYRVNNYFFSNEKMNVKGYHCIFPVDDDGDFLEEGNFTGISFKKRVGLLDLTNRKCYRI